MSNQKTVYQIISDLFVDRKNNFSLNHADETISFTLFPPLCKTHSYLAFIS